ncbi:MAX dimerization protein MGA a isoform X2 [Stegastes partitus]|uniref:MAX dimerization protein MGA a isoform X2 n=1 Tax=Stegastes partitus TaxID=144197 RepID=A0A9Y4MQB9_9TELE|nr:PREDICTED: MAX gene-associated protein isoform X2 [Stegastes partitus]
MAPKKQKRGMVFHQERGSTPAVAPAAEHPPARSGASRPGRASEGGVDQSSHVTSEGADIRSKLNMSPSREAVRRTSGLKPPQSDNLSPDSVCRGVRVTLDNNSMWNEFYRCRTEMILNKQGSRMFPYCRFRIAGLQPSKKYTLIMDIQPLDNSCYKWTGNSWQIAGKAESPIKSQPFAHPESPAMGQHWMQSPVSFYRLKLTNNGSDQEGNTILHPMHRYLPRLHVVQTDRAAKDVKLNGPSVLTFTFPQTEFMAVTAYQNTRFAQLKVDYNPFAKGLKEDGCNSRSLKLKANSGKELHKDGGTPTTEQHPVKKSLKSLLANHKPRSSNTADSRPSDVQKNPTTNKDPPAAKAPGESSCTSNSRPAQKLISELIREAHVSLQRCNLEQLGINHSSSLTAEQTNTKPTTLKGKGQEVLQRDNKEPAGKTETDVTKKNVKEDTHLLNSVKCKVNVQTDCNSAASAGSSKDSDHQRNPDTPSQQTTKPDKRPPRLPLPALALFLKQHSTKSKKAKSKLDSPPPETHSEPLSESLSSAAASACLPLDPATNAIDPLKDLNGDVTKPNAQASRHAGADLHLDEVVLNVHQPLSLLCPDTAAASGPVGPRTDDQSASFSESPGLQPTVPHSTVLPSSEQPFSSLEESTSTLSSTLATSSASPPLSPPLDTVLPVPNSPQTPPESSTLPSDSPTLKSESFLPDPECSSFGFEPLSPTSSPEPLPPLPASLALELDTTSSEAACTAEPPEDSPPSKDSSVFKWHTVLPLPEPYLDAPFTTFQPTSETLPLEHVTPPLLPSETPSHPEPHSLNTSTPPQGPPPSFQESEQSLPFPAELSPLALQLPLSPTFSSLGGEGLSPTPSIADLVHFFSTDDDLGMGVEFSNTEAVAVPCPPPPAVEAQEPSQQVQPVPVNKPYKRKKTRRRKQPKTSLNEKTDDTTYRSMQPNLEEVEEQLFISFTSKEALKLHTVDSSDGPGTQPQTTSESPQAADTPEKAECLDETIAAFQKNLLNDLKLMKHRQVIHPVLQEVGLKMTLLDPTLAIDLQYLGVRLPIPPPGVSLEPLTQELQSSQGVSAAFVSRTGKTTDVTQIKGWRDKFSPSEAPSTPASSRPEAGPSSEPQKKNLSAFCSDMLDEYLENEGKLIDERAASFSQPPVEPLVYELPTRSTSYVRTLDHILKKQNTGSPAADLISGFIPPSKRPRLTETKAGRTLERKPRGQKLNKPRAEPFEPAPGESGPPSANTAEPTLKKRRKLKLKTTSRTLSPSRSTGLLKDLAPLESDSELGQKEDTGRKERRPLMTRALLRQKDLEDSVIWEGRPRTGITEQRATVALTSLFTLTGFVSENPTAPIELVRRRAPPPCLNEFCRLGCVCSSLSHCSRISHCGRLSCMFGCSCLKQKVVLLKNLDGSDCSPPSHQLHNKRRKRRRMKMAYILKEADSVSQPAQRVRTLWGRDCGDSDPEGVHVPKAAPQPSSTVRTLEGRENRSSCARVRAFRRKIKKQKEASKDVNCKPARLTSLKQRNLTLKETETRTSRPPPGEAVQTPPEEPPASPSEDPIPKPSKRLFIVADCKWETSADQSHVLKQLCEAMAQDRLDRPFKIRKYLVSPVSQTVEGDGADQCIQYKVRISRVKPEQEKSEAPVKPVASTKPAGPVKPAVPVKPAAPRTQRKMKAAQKKQDDLRQAPLEDWQQEVMEEVEPLEVWQQEVVEEAEPLEDWQREVEEGDIDEEEVSTLQQVNDRKRSSKSRIRMVPDTALPFLTGISPAGFLSANKKQPGGTDHPIQVNGKLYPLAKIQLGKMGALHPANRLAAYLTGRVGSSRQQQASPSLSPCKPPLRSAPTSSSSSSSSSAVASTSTTPPTSQPPVTSLIIPTSSTASQPSSPVVPPVNPSPGSAPPKTPQFLMVHVAGPMGQLPPQVPATSPTGQKLVLQPVQTASGLQYYRRPDGKLVQLVPLNQVKPVGRNPSAQKGPSSPSILLPASPQTPAVITISQQTPPVTTVTSSSSSSSSFSVNTLAPLPPGSDFLSQKGPCTFKLLPSRRDPLIIPGKGSSQQPATVVTPSGSFTILQPPPSTSSAAPVTLISLKPSSGRGAEPGVKTVKVSAMPLAPGLVVVRQKTVPPQNFDSKTADKRPVPPPPPPTDATPALPPPGASEVTLPPNPPADGLRPEPELACDLVDLDIICVDDDMGLDTATMQPADVVELVSSSETDNSSDCRESDSEEESQPPKSNQRLMHKTLERERRGKLRQLFDALRRQTGLSDSRTSKICTLNTAVEVIEELQTIETELEKKKRMLRKRRDEYLSRLAPSSDQTEADSIEVVDVLDDTIKISSEEEIDVEEGCWGVSKERNRPWMTRRRSEADETTGATIFPKKLQLHQARQEIQTLKSTMEELKSLKTSLKQQKDAQSSGEKPGKTEQRSANQLPAGDTIDEDVTGTLFDVQPPQAPPTRVSALPTPTPAQPPLVAQVLTSVPPRPAASHNAPVQRDRPRTIPNILSRRKSRPPPPQSTTTEEVHPPVEPPSFQALLPAEVLSLVRASLPGQQVLALSPVMTEPTVLQSAQRPGVASVTLNIPNLPNQQLHLTSLPRPPTSKIYSSPAPLTVTNLTATDFSNMLHLAQPAITEQQQQQTDKQQTQQQQTHPVDLQLVSVGSDRIPDQVRPPSQAELRPSSFPSLSADRQSQEKGTEPPEIRGDPENETLTSLLNEIFFLNQQNVATTTEVSSLGKPSYEDATKLGGAKERQDAHIPGQLQLDSDCNSTVATETEGAGLNGHTETTGVQPGPANTIGGKLAPPPLLQMKVGGDKVAPPSTSDGVAGVSSTEGGEGGVAWRPMPRLVPLGLRGNLPS